MYAYRHFTATRDWCTDISPLQPIIAQIRRLRHSVYIYTCTSDEECTYLADSIVYTVI